jgi:hypothetical protein
MDIVNVSFRVRTIACRMYRTPVRYSIHYLCDVNNTPSSDSCSLTETLHHILLKCECSTMNSRGRTVQDLHVAQDSNELQRYHKEHLLEWYDSFTEATQDKAI